MQFEDNVEDQLIIYRLVNNLRYKFCFCYMTFFMSNVCISIIGKISKPRRYLYGIYIYIKLDAIIFQMFAPSASTATTFQPGDKSRKVVILTRRERMQNSVPRNTSLLENEGRIKDARLNLTMSEEEVLSELKRPFGLPASERY